MRHPQTDLYAQTLSRYPFLLSLAKEKVIIMDDIFSKVDRTAFSVVSLYDAGNNTAFWLSRTPAERFAAIEYYRQQMYNYDPTVERLQRVLETAEFKTS